LAILVFGEVDRTERAAPNLLLHQVLVDSMLGRSVIFAVAVLGARIEGFLVGVTGCVCNWSLHNVPSTARNAYSIA
jgi:hypothetical protein